MNRDQLAKTIYDTCNLKGSFRLRSGQVSDEYFDKYQLESRPALLASIAEGLAGILPPETQLLAGLEMGGIPLSTALALRTGLSMVLVRKKAKDYGTCKVAEGVDFKGKKVTIIEDVVTTGGAIIDGARALRDQGAVLETVLCVIDREQGGADKLRQIDLTLKPLFVASDLRRAAGVPTKA